MMKLNRRDLLKLAGMVGGSIFVPSFMQDMPHVSPEEGKKNILILVFDAFSAHNISLYGYGRETTPNLARLAQQAVVYHNHLAGGNFTTPGTASLLTGTYPWTHRAIQVNGIVDPAYRNRSLFHAFNGYHRFAYSHNPFANTLFFQFQNDIDDFIPIDSLLLTSDGLVQRLFRRDGDISGLSWMRAIKQSQNEGSSYSLFIPGLYELDRESRIESVKASFPLGLPYIQSDNYFTLEQTVDFLIAQLNGLPRPFMGYFHVIPPHAPYNTRDDFFDRFKNDQFQPPPKPTHPFGGRRRTPEFLARLRREYDEYILYVDHEFNRLMEDLRQSGILEDTWVILTSDHGELFERNFWAHSAAVLYQPVIHIPLLIFEPRRTERLDIHTPTSAVDILPTLLHLTGSPSAPWSEGVLLPPFGNTNVETDRSIYAFESRDSEPNTFPKEGVTALVKGRYKLTHTYGYQKLQGGYLVELYDIESDPEELHELSSTQPNIRNDLLDELTTKLAEVKKNFD